MKDTNSALTLSSETTVRVVVSITDADPNSSTYGTDKVVSVDVTNPLPDAPAHRYSAATSLGGDDAIRVGILEAAKMAGEQARLLYVDLLDNRAAVVELNAANTTQEGRANAWTS